MGNKTRTSETVSFPVDFRPRFFGKDEILGSAQRPSLHIEEDTCTAPKVVPLPSFVNMHGIGNPEQTLQNPGQGLLDKSFSQYQLGTPLAETMKQEIAQNIRVTHDRTETAGEKSTHKKIDLTSLHPVFHGPARALVLQKLENKYGELVSCQGPRRVEGGRGVVQSVKL